MLRVTIRCPDNISILGDNGIKIFFMFDGKIRNSVRRFIDSLYAYAST